jgi:hypothetical protein
VLLQNEKGAPELSGASHIPQLTRLLIQGLVDRQGGSVGEPPILARRGSKRRRLLSGEPWFVEGS